MRIVTAAVGLALVSFTATAAFAQATGKPKDDEPQFDRDVKRGKAAASREPATPEEALDHALPLITTWPSDAGEKALRALIARGPDLLPLLRARLKGGTVLERSAAARGLCLLSDVDSFREIERLFGDPRQLRRAGALLESLFELDETKAGELALKLLDTDRAQLRSAATALFKAHATPALVATLKERLVATTNEAARFDLFELLAALQEPELPAIALDRFLGDPSPQLAAAVAQLLSWQESPQTRAELARLATTRRDRRGLHAALALALGEQRLGAPLLPDALFDVFAPSLRTNDLLLRATSCVVCGMVGYRSEARAEATQARVLPALSDLVVNGRFFGDFELCFNASVRTLELLTGERLGASVPAWRDYFANPSAEARQGRRELKAFVLDEDVPIATVRLTRVDRLGGEKRLLALCGPGLLLAVGAGRRPGEVALGDVEMRSLLTGLESQGLLSSELPRRFDVPVDGGLLLTVDARSRERTVALAPDEPRAAPIVALLRRSAETASWQLLLPAGEGFAKTFLEEQAWFATHPDPVARRGRLVDLALALIGADDASAAQQAFDVLARVDSLGEAVRATQIDALAALLSRLSGGDPRARRLFELLVATRRADAFDRLVDALSSRGAAGVEWLADAQSRLGRVAQDVADPRPVVRVAALTAIARGGVALPSEDQLVALATQDGDEQVRARALALLARSGGELAGVTLGKIAGEGGGTLRVEALRLLGSVRTDDALTQLVAAARGDDGQLAAAALEGLSRRADDAAAAALEGIVRERGAEGALGRLALAAIKGLPRDLALPRLRKLQAEGDAVVAHEAAYGLADLGEVTAAPMLLADLEDAKLQRRALTLLTYLLCKDLGTETWRYRSLYESQPLATHADHFLASLKESGALVPDGDDLRDRAFVPLLVAAIEDPRWFVRRSALEFLEAATGRDLGSLPVAASREEIAELARRWREATTTQARGDGPH